MKRYSILAAALTFLAAPLIAQDRQAASENQNSTGRLQLLAYYGPQDRDHDRDRDHGRDRDHDRDRDWDRDRDSAWHRAEPSGCLCELGTRANALAENKFQPSRAGSWGPVGPAPARKQTPPSGPARRRRPGELLRIVRAAGSACRRHRRCSARPYRVPRCRAEPSRRSARIAEG